MSKLASYPSKNIDMSYLCPYCHKQPHPSRGFRDSQEQQRWYECRQAVREISKEWRAKASAEGKANYQRGVEKMRKYPFLVDIEYNNQGAAIADCKLYGGIPIQSKSFSTLEEAKKFFKTLQAARKQEQANFTGLELIDRTCGWKVVKV